MKYVYKVWEKGYNRPSLRHCAVACKRMYSAFAPAGEYHKAVPSPFEPGSKKKIDLGYFDVYPGTDEFERYESKTNRKGQFVRGKTVLFKFLGTIESAEMPDHDPEEEM